MYTLKKKRSNFYFAELLYHTLLVVVVIRVWGCNSTSEIAQRNFLRPITKGWHIGISPFTTTYAWKPFKMFCSVIGRIKSGQESSKIIMITSQVNLCLGSLIHLIDNFKSKESPIGAIQDMSFLVTLRIDNSTRRNKGYFSLDNQHWVYQV